MSIKNVTQMIFNRQLRRAHGDDKAADTKDAKKGQAKDSAHISSAAKEVFSVVGGARQVDDVVEVSSTGAIKDLDEIKERVAAGYYDKPEVIEEVASAIVRSGDLEEDSSKPDKIALAKERVEEGFYDQQEVIENVAAKLIRLLES